MSYFLGDSEPRLFGAEAEVSRKRSKRVRDETNIDMWKEIQELRKENKHLASCLQESKRGISRDSSSIINIKGHGVVHLAFTL